MTGPSIEYVTTECPSGHRVRGDIGWLNRNVRCPHCNAEFTFQRPEGQAAEVVALDGLRFGRRQSVSDTGVMRILGDFVGAAAKDDGTKRQCSECGAIYPNYVSSCYSCNAPLSPLVRTSASEEEKEGIDFQAINAFPFQDVEVRTVMRQVKEIEVLDANDKLESILDRVRKSLHTRYPVCDAGLDSVLGVVHIEDIVLADADDFEIQSIIRPLEVIPANAMVSETLQKLQDSGEPIALVCDDAKTVIGMVTIKDVMLKIAKK